MMKKFLVYLFVIVAFTIQVNAQVNWTKYPGNPVLTKGTNGDWDDVAVGSPSIIYDGKLYHMWYNGNDGSNTNIGYATSTDKVNWEKYPIPVLEHGPSGSWDDLYILHPTVYFDDSTYHMWYTGNNGSVGQIGYATSPDYIHWTKYSGNPVLKPNERGGWDGQNVNSPEVLFIDGVFHMWYSGFNGSYEQIGHATSLDGITWEKDELNPVLKIGMTGNWDNANSTQPSVLFDGTMFHMWYGGGPDFGWRIGYAYSEDGRNWNKDDLNNPVLEPGSAGNWDSEYVGYHTVCFNSDSTGFDMWYTGSASTGYVGDIGYATVQIPPIDFTNKPLIKYDGNPVLPKGVDGDWDIVAVGSPTIIYDGTTYQMWFNGSDGNNASIGYATSTNKINWDKHPTPVLEHGANGSWDDVYALHPSVYFDGTTYHMWYTGVNGSFGQIGYATSPDSISWTKYSGNPVLTLGTSGSWDDQSVNSPDVLFIDGVLHMWYTGFDGSHEQIGHATSVDGINWEKDTLNPVLKVGNPGSWDYASSTQPSVLFDGTYFHLFYGGGPDFSWKIGYAYSEDGRNWNKDDLNNPVLGQGSAGNWDSEYVGYQTVCFNSDSRGFDMWYTGASGSGYVGDIGFASTDPIITSVKNENLNVIPNEFSLSQNYPNPFNPSTKIRYQVPTTGLVSLRVYNLLGEVVTTLVNEEKPAGTYEVEFSSHSGEVRNLSSGVYFYKLKAGNFVETKKMLLLK